MHPQGVNMVSLSPDALIGPLTNEAAMTRSILRRLRTGLPSPRLPPLVLFLIQQTVAGAALGVAFAGLLVAVDAGGLQTLIRESASPLVPLILLSVGFASLIGGLYAAAAVMLMPDDD
jgi:hypothetical protein